MNINEFLRKVYEANPDGWNIEVLCGVQGWVRLTAKASRMIVEHTTVRLRPILPKGLPPVPDEACLYGPERGGFPLGYGLARGYQRFGTISAWVFRLPELGWERFGAFFNLTGTYYILDVSDPNSRAMLEHNGLWPGDGEPEANEPDLAGMLQRDITKLETAGMEEVG